jgi:hypothetical protein
MLFDLGRLQERRLGQARFSIGTQAPKKYLNLKLFDNIGGAMEETTNIVHIA